jgi:hypothetical protein
MSEEESKREGRRRGRLEALDCAFKLRNAVLKRDLRGSIDLDAAN